MSHSNNGISSNIQAILLSIFLLSSIFYFTGVLAQEDEEEEEEDKEEEEEDNKDKEDEGSKGEGEGEEGEEIEQQPAPIEETTTEETNNNATVPNQIIQDPVNTTIVPPLPLNPAVAALTETPREFNATCKCYTNDKIKDFSLISSEPSATTSIQQIPLTDTNIQVSESSGQVIDPTYTGFYTVSKVLDNKIDDISFWSQAGKSSFYIKLDSTLDGYQVCSMDIIANKVTNSPFTLDIGGIAENFTGVIDQIPKKVQFNACYKNVDEFIMSFDNPEDQFISIAELKLFGKSLSSTTALPTTKGQPQQLPKEQPTTTPKINIEGSNAEIDIKNSTVTFKFDPLTGTFVGQPS